LRASFAGFARPTLAFVRRLRVLWWVLVGVGFAGAVALTIAVYLFDSTPSHLLFAALPAYGVALGLTRSWLKGRSGADDGRLSR
jgi:hypothetical protein